MSIPLKTISKIKESLKMKHNIKISSLVLALTLSLSTLSYAASDALNFNSLNTIISQKDHFDLDSNPAQALPSGIFARLNTIKSHKDIKYQRGNPNQSEKLGLTKIVNDKLSLNYNR